MSSLASIAATVPQFTGLKAGQAAPRALTTAMLPAMKAPAMMSVRASLKDIGVIVAATAASALLAGSALAAEKTVLLGSDNGELVFEPKEITISSGDTLVFKNNAGFPHNVVFDEDEVPPGVDAGKISMEETALLNAKGETYSVTLTEKGPYSFYCAPHQGAGMVGKVTVN